MSHRSFNRNIARKPLKSVSFGTEMSQISNSSVCKKLKNLRSRSNLNWDDLFLQKKWLCFFSYILIFYLNLTSVKRSNILNSLQTKSGFSSGGPHADWWTPTLPQKDSNLSAAGLYSHRQRTKLLVSRLQLLFKSTTNSRLADCSKLSVALWGEIFYPMHIHV